MPKLTCSSARPARRTSRTAFADLEIDPFDQLLGFAPYLHKAPRRNSITPDRQRAFIAALAATGIVTQAARSIGASLEALYRLRHQPGAEGFAAAWEAAIDRGIARLEDCALERAIQGEPRFVVRGGEVVATWTRYDTQLLIFLLRQRRPLRWRDAEPPTPPERSQEEILASIDAKIDRMRAIKRAQHEAAKAAATRTADGVGQSRDGAGSDSADSGEIGPVPITAALPKAWEAALAADPPRLPDSASGLPAPSAPAGDAVPAEPDVAGTPPAGAGRAGPRISSF